MKKITLFVTCLSLYLLSLSANAQNKSAYLAYDYSDSIAVSPAYCTGYYLWPPMNSRYTINDTGNHSTTYSFNQLLIRNCSVAFDTLLDAASGKGYNPANISSLTVDTLQIVIGHANTSGTNDTIIVQINSVDATGFPTANVLWANTLITDTSLSPGHSYYNNYTVLMTPNYTLPSGAKFAVTMYYYGSLLDTMCYIYRFPTFVCDTPAGPWADSTKFGYKFAGMPANSFTTGYVIFGLGQLTLPNSSWGELVGFSCDTPATRMPIFFQDIAMYANVSFTIVPTVINNLNANGFTVGRNVPNPFNKTTEITYTLAQSSDVVFNVFDLTGRKLMENTYSSIAPGEHTINLSANHFAPGIYFYTIRVNGEAVTKKMIVSYKL